VVVSAQFEGLNRVKRHQKVYGTLGELMGEFHALALHTYTPEEWAADRRGSGIADLCWR
jgi:BolA protein